MDGDIEKHSHHRSEKIREGIPRAAFTAGNEVLMDFVTDPEKRGEAHDRENETQASQMEIMPERRRDEETEEGIFEGVGDLVVGDMKGGTGRKVKNQSAVRENKEPIEGFVLNQDKTLK